MQPSTSHNNEATADTNNHKCQLNFFPTPTSSRTSSTLLQGSLSNKARTSIASFTPSLYVSWRPSARLTDRCSVPTGTESTSQLLHSKHRNTQVFACSSSRWELWFWQFITRQIYRGGDRVHSTKSCPSSLRSTWPCNLVIWDFICHKWIHKNAPFF